MPFYKFGPDDIFHNRIKTHPQVNFFIYDRQVYYNNKGYVAGVNTQNAGMVPVGYINLYELNVDRPSGQLIYPFITKDGSLTSFRTVTTSKFNTDFLFGSIITGSYPLSASISSDRYAEAHNSTGSQTKISALRNSLNNYKTLSPTFAFSSSLGDKSKQELRLISIPSIFYGSSIQKGTVSLKFYLSGAVLSELRDDMKNGELRQVASSSIDGGAGQAADSGSVAGVVMYNEGFMILTGSWPLSSHTEPYTVGSSPHRPRWIDFGSTGSTGTNENLPSSSFALNFSGTNYVPTLTMLAHAPLGKLNYSNNPTSIAHGEPQIQPSQTGSTVYVEPKYRKIKNVGSSSYEDTVPTFDKIVFISQIGLYDENKNLIGIAKVANPVRKRTQDDFTFKLKLDF